MKTRSVTLILQGGHLVRLGGVESLEALLDCLQNPTDDIIDIQTEWTDRLVIRGDALLGFFDSYANLAETFPPLGPDLGQIKPYVRFEGFLTPEDHSQVINRALQLEGSFEGSKVTTGREDYRKSLLLSEDEVVGPIFRNYIKRAVLFVAQSLGLSLRNQPDDHQIECQITAHRDGGFFHAHSDNGSPATSSRLLTYVYYFRARPAGFFGGELKLYNSRVENGVELIAQDFHLISPTDNSIVFFPSRTWHEVLPTYVPSGAFCDSRFTVNGWIKQVESNDC